MRTWSPSGCWGRACLRSVELESESESESELPLMVLDRPLAGRRCSLFLAIVGLNTRGVEEVVSEVIVVGGWSRW